MKTNFTHISRFPQFLMILLLGVFIQVGAIAQDACTCKGAIQVSLDETGTATITKEMLLASPEACGDVIDVYVELAATGAIIPGYDVIDCSYVGQTLWGVVVREGGNSCWTTITVEDKLKPVIECPSLLTINCGDIDDYTPVYYDNCGEVTLDLVSETITVNNCNLGWSDNVLERITRVYKATDASGNVTTSCPITIDVLALNPDDIDNPDSFTVLNGNPLDCSGDWPKDHKGNPSPFPGIGHSGTGVPSINGKPLYGDGADCCNITVTYSDTEITTCCGKTKAIMREWKFFESSCLNRVISSHIQQIEIVDSQAPVISGLVDIEVTTDENCEGVVNFPAPTLTDNCTNTSLLTYTITVYQNGDWSVPGPHIAHGQPRVAALPVGSHKAVYVAYDKSDNSSRDTINVYVEDNTPPVAICKEMTTVGLTSNGKAWVPASSIDDLSYDECGLQNIFVKRMVTDNCGACEVPTFKGFTFLGDYGTGSNKHYYYVSTTKATPKAAYKTAKAMEGNVVSYNDLSEVTWVGQAAYNKLPTTYDGFLIGFNNVSTSNFVWQSGEVTNYSYPWASGEPSGSGNYVVHNRDGKWTNVNNSDKYYYVIEITDICGFSDGVTFCCSDIGDNQMVVMRAIDNAGNYNDCMVSVVVQDKIGPTIECPADVTVNCDFVYDLDNLAADFGEATARDNCEVLDISESHTVNINDCRIGAITRTFTVTDAGGRQATCTQTITFETIDPYSGPTIADWPADISIVGCDNTESPEFDPDVTGRPVLNSDACSLVSSSYKDEVYRFNNPSSPSCFKIIRTWTVMDCCQFNTDGSYKKWTHEQVIMAIDNEAPVIEDIDSEISVDTYDAACQGGFITLTASATDNCTVTLKNKYVIYDEDNNVEKSQSYKDGNSIDASGIYAVGTHRIVYTFEDKCGNISSKEQVFHIVNKKVPGIIVIKGLAANLSKIGEGQAEVDIWAEDFDPEGKSEHPCGYDLYYSFSQMTLGSNGLPVGTPNHVYTCDDIGEQPVTIWVASVTPAGDIVQDYVETFIDIQDNNDVCPGTGGRVAIGGLLATESNEELEGAYVSLVGTELTKVTGQDGVYNFGNMAMGGQYSIVPEKNDDPMNGVSTLDLVIIQRHILGIEKLNSPYKQIAADANRDNKISVSDLSEIRKLILGTKDGFNDNTSWRFVDKSYHFFNADDALGEAFPEIYNIDVLNTNIKTDFVAVKTGDVDGDAITNSLNGNVDTRTNANVVLTTENVHFEGGQMVNVPVKVSDLTKFSGIQFTFEFNRNQLALTGIDPAAMNVNDGNFGLNRMDDGILTVSWNSADVANFNSDETLFNLTFMAKDEGEIMNAIKVSSAITKAEAYSVNYEKMGVVFRVSDRFNGYELFQNTPNPFKHNTTVEFTLPQDMPVIFTVYDVTGKVVKDIRLNGNKGMNTIDFNKDNLRSGVLYYTLRAGEFLSTKKMVIIE